MKHWIPVLKGDQTRPSEQGVTGSCTVRGITPGWQSQFLGSLLLGGLFVYVHPCKSKWICFIQTREGHSKLNTIMNIPRTGSVFHSLRVGLSPIHTETYIPSYSPQFSALVKLSVAKCLLGTRRKQTFFTDSGPNFRCVSVHTNSRFQTSALEPGSFKHTRLCASCSPWSSAAAVLSLTQSISRVSLSTSPRCCPRY